MQQPSNNTSICNSQATCNSTSNSTSPQVLKSEQHKSSSPQVWTYLVYNFLQSWIHLYPKYIASNEKKIALVYAESKNDKGTDFTSPQVWTFYMLNSSSIQV
jgi:hypothetical protein